MLFLVIAVVVAIIVLFFAVLVVLALAASRRLASPPRRIGKWTPSDLGLSYERIEYKTREGIVLRGWLVKGSTDKAIVLIHGYTSSKWDEDYMKPALEVLGKNGYTVLVVDMRGHGESDGEYTTLGYRESDDVVELVDFLRRNGYGRIGVYGFSMGGAISIMTAAKTGVDAIVLDSPYVDVRSSGKRWIMRIPGVLGLLLRMAYPLIMFFTSRRIGVDPEELVMYKYAEKVHVPVMLVAPTRDDLISLDEYKKLEEVLRKNAPVVETWYVETRHVGAWKDYRSEYEEKLLGFLQKHL
ncbi:MAG: alpha/beta fold hydrolase [Thermoprotei archaeon]